jgi:hypothetical protein
VRLAMWSLAGRLDSPPIPSGCLALLCRPAASQVPKALWLKQNEPGVYDRAHWICEYQVEGGRAVCR